jgi:predicted PurR-regulated permease PerM
VSDLLWTGGLGVVGIGGQAVTVLLLTIFLLYEDDRFKRVLVAQMQSMNNQRITVRILNDIAKQIERFIWVQVLTSAAVGVSQPGSVLWWLGIDEPAVWGVFAGLLNIVPYFGPLVVTAGLTIVGYLQFGTLEQTAIVAGAALAITTIEGMFLTPHLLSRAASLNHVAMFIAIAFWSWAWGVPECSSPSDADGVQSGLRSRRRPAGPRTVRSVSEPRRVYRARPGLRTKGEPCSWISVTGYAERENRESEFK